MRFYFRKIDLVFKKSKETILFSDISYYYGQMGAGKSSIARLIDYCLGGDLDYSPALQSEFVSATLHLTVNDASLSIERPRESNCVRATWFTYDQQYDLILPARKAEGIVIPNTEVEVLSDLLFHLAGIRPPRVRKSKQSENSELTRLSIRDLLWYCYLDQDSMDSSFFNLDAEANPFKRNKSRDVLRFIIGFHQEKVSELETQLQEIREHHHQLATAANSLKGVLKETKLSSEEEITECSEILAQELKALNEDIANIHSRLSVSTIPHGVDTLRNKAKNLSYEIESIEDAISEVEKFIMEDQRHINELRMLNIKFHRVTAARAVLSGVEFEACPRCAQNLPEREQGKCSVCGQEDPESGSQNLDSEVLESDTKSRIKELKEAIDKHKAQLRIMQLRICELRNEKSQIDQEINNAMDKYDSAYLSTALVLERRKSRIEQKIENMKELVKLPLKVKELIHHASKLEVKEKELRLQLIETRKSAESDMTNLSRLEELFLDCLVRARIPGITPEDKVCIQSPNFLPEVTNTKIGNLAITSFSNLSSGGKKTLFKACFAIAVHRLAVEVNALLPTFLIVDSPMKNISERENKEQFEVFHTLIYKLVSSELKGTQVIIIDKEYCPIPRELGLSSVTRYMTPDSKESPPLIPYYRGH